jgi:hypothetical protein
MICLLFHGGVIEILLLSINISGVMSMSWVQ